MRNLTIAIVLGLLVAWSFAAMGLFITHFHKDSGYANKAHRTAVTTSISAKSQTANEETTRDLRDTTAE